MYNRLCPHSCLIFFSAVILLSRFSSFTSNLCVMDRPLLRRVSARGCCSYSALKAWLPILSWLPKYNLKWLQMDLLAGLTVGLTTVPQALAYAEVAGLPVQVKVQLQICNNKENTFLSGGELWLLMKTFISYSSVYVNAFLSIVWALFCLHGGIHLHSPGDL